MPSTQKSDKWFFRITLPHEAVAMLWTQALSTVKLIDMTRCLIVSHIGEKTEKQHVHGIIELSKVIQKQSFDVRLKSIFPVTGADYSSKQWDGGMEHGAGSYMYHDPSATEIYNKGFTQEHLNRFRECHADIAEVVEENKSRASGRCVDRILALIKTSNHNWTRKEILMNMLNDIKEDRMYECGDFVLAKYCEEIYMKQMTNTDWQQYANYRVSHILRFEQQELFSKIET